MNNSVWEKQRKRLFELIEIGSNYDAWCWGYDFFNTFTILLNLTVSIMYTFDTICRFSSHPVQSHSVCCESSVFSVCSASMLITIH